MTTLRRRATRSAMILLLGAGGCAGAGNVGDILGGVLGGSGAGQGGQASQVSGTVLGVDDRQQQLVIQLRDGQQAALLYDRQTRVVYQNQEYPVANLERGDRITARIRQASDGDYYTDLVQVDQSVSSGNADGGGASGSVQSIQGTVGQVDRQNGLFSLDVRGYGTVVVALPFNVGRADLNTFQSLRQGDRVRLYGVFLNDTRVELRQFY